MNVKQQRKLVFFYFSDFECLITNKIDIKIWLLLILITSRQLQLDKNHFRQNIYNLKIQSLACFHCYIELNGEMSALMMTHPFLRVQSVKRGDILKFQTSHMLTVKRRSNPPFQHTYIHICNIAKLFCNFIYCQSAFRSARTLL